MRGRGPRFTAAGPCVTIRHQRRPPRCRVEARGARDVGREPAGAPAAPRRGRRSGRSARLASMPFRLGRQRGHRPRCRQQSPSLGGPGPNLVSSLLSGLHPPATRLPSSVPVRSLFSGSSLHAADRACDLPMRHALGSAVVSLLAIAFLRGSASRSSRCCGPRGRPPTEATDASRRAPTDVGLIQVLIGLWIVLVLIETRQGSRKGCSLPGAIGTEPANCDAAVEHDRAPRRVRRTSRGADPAHAGSNPVSRATSSSRRPRYTGSASQVAGAQCSKPPIGDPSSIERRRPRQAPSGWDHDA
jgi:hypothetical protein